MERYSQKFADVVTARVHHMPHYISNGYLEGESRFAYIRTTGTVFMPCLVGMATQQILIRRRQSDPVHRGSHIGFEVGHVRHQAADTGDIGIVPNRFKSGLLGGKTLTDEAFGQLHRCFTLCTRVCSAVYRDGP